MNTIFDILEDISEQSEIQKTRYGAQLISNAIKSGCCDLHIHTHASDGSESAASIVQKVIENNLKFFSVTDHDSVEGVADVLRVLKKLKGIGMTCPCFIPGIELSIEEGREIHILGYFPFGGYEKISEFILAQQQSRHNRNIKMCELLTKEGMPVSIEELKAQGTTVVGKLHAAHILMRKGYVGSVKEAFDNWIGYNKPCYAKRLKPTAKDAIKAITDAGGVPVLAHPYLYDWTSGTHQVSDALLSKLEALKSAGLLGVEAFHGEANSAQSLETLGAAITLDLIPTVGSDYHGLNKPGLRMYSDRNVFSHENEEIVVAAILEINGKYVVTKENKGISTQKQRHIENGINNSSDEYKMTKMEDGAEDFVLNFNTLVTDSNSNKHEEELITKLKETNLTKAFGSGNIEKSPNEHFDRAKPISDFFKDPQDSWGFIGTALMRDVELENHKEKENSLLNTLKNEFGIDTMINSHYSTMVFENDAKRTIFISYVCTAEKEQLLNCCSDSCQIGLFTLGELAAMNLKSPDGMVIDKLREISFL